MIRNNLLLIFFSLYLSSCVYLPYHDEMWYKHGEDRIEVRKALLECGLSTVGISEEFTEICMLISGFRQKDEYALLFREYPIDICNPPYTERPAICDTVPTRNTEYRLNSLYCNGKGGIIFKKSYGENFGIYSTYRKNETDPVPWECLP